MSDNEHEAKMARPRMASGALFFDDQGRVMMLEPTYKDYREIPGGYVETGESPLQACVREVREELGISPEIGRLLAVDWAPSPGEGDKLLYLFDGGVLTAELRERIRLQTTEIGAYDFHPVDTVAKLTIPRLARRIEAAAAARAEGRVAYLEHGRAAGSGSLELPQQP
ncbi:NUDIX hydrolase [Streptomyces sioyaensis]|uniref:NUDIX hydrolase n=1 Tax=Streptomyces sioyaensis TaxID=67364 RepID=A0A4Q1QPR7_9ACTN|nr:NUDIX hydrolase [Streptomyces sioyaensis]MBM4794599.1 NUDIX hydrolase [Streptomyces sioyaensis]RXS62280.1 NUDIX hydrolase [Streptomyces sioyaensis]